MSIFEYNPDDLLESLADDYDGSNLFSEEDDDTFYGEAVRQRPPRPGSHPAPRHAPRPSRPRPSFSATSRPGPVQVPRPGANQQVATEGQIQQLQEQLVTLKEQVAKALQKENTLSAAAEERLNRIAAAQKKELNELRRNLLLSSVLSPLPEPNKVITITEEVKSSTGTLIPKDTVLKTNLANRDLTGVEQLFKFFPMLGMSQSGGSNGGGLGLPMLLLFSTVLSSKQDSSSSSNATSNSDLGKNLPMIILLMTMMPQIN